MGIRMAAAFAATAISGVATGWWLHAPEPLVLPECHNAPAVVASSAASTAPPSSVPLIAVASDGNVTLRVEQQPLEWVLEQIAAQSGWGDVRERAGVAPRASCAEASAARPAAGT
jgi:hypothetical protein